MSRKGAGAVIFGMVAFVIAWPIVFLAIQPGPEGVMGMLQVRRFAAPSALIGAAVALVVGLLTFALLRTERPGFGSYDDDSRLR